MRDAAGNAGGGKAKVLVVEDDAEMRGLLCDVLAGYGFEVRGVANDAQALMSLRQGVVDAVLLDKNLPDLSGLEILPGIRCMFPVVPVILVSAFGDATTEVRARERGATAFLSKPFRMADLVRVIERHMPPLETPA